MKAGSGGVAPKLRCVCIQTLRVKKGIGNLILQIKLSLYTPCKSVTDTTIWA